MALSNSSPHCDPHPESFKTYRNCPDDLTSLFLPIVSWLSCWHTIKEMLFIKKNVINAGPLHFKSLNFSRCFPTNANLYVLTGAELGYRTSALWNPQLQNDFSSQAVLYFHLENLHFPLLWPVNWFAYDGDVFYLQYLRCQLLVTTCTALLFQSYW